jgi:hypothetical protein
MRGWWCRLCQKTELCCHRDYADVRLGRLSEKMIRSCRKGGISSLAIALLALLVLGTAIIVWFHSRPPAPMVGPMLVVSGDTEGWITPGCTPKQPGGLARRASYLASLRDLGSVIYVDAGGAASGTSEYHKMKFETMLEGERAMQIAAHNLGKSELALGAEYIRRVGSRMHFPFVSDNARDSAGKRIIDNRRMIEVDGVRIGIIGVVSRQYATSEIFIEDPRQAVEDAASAMRKQCQTLIVLAYMPEDELRELSTALPEVDAIIGGAQKRMIAPQSAGATMLAAAGEYGTHLVEMRVPLGRSGGAWEGQMVEMNSTIADDAMQVNNLQRYLGMLEDRDFAAVESEVAGPLRAGANEVLAGSAACLKCHTGDYNTWIASRHARAFASLQQSGFGADSQCQSCHTSGFGVAGGFVSARQSARSESAGVGCEMCHGPSAAHAKDPKKKTTAMAIVQCVRCHNEENCAAFDYEKSWEKIRHGDGVKKLR